MVNAQQTHVYCYAPVVLVAAISTRYAKSASNKGTKSKLPPVRGQTSVSTMAGASTTKPKSAKKRKKGKKSIPGGDFRAWDKYVYY